MFPKVFSIPAFDLFGRHLGPLTLHSYGLLMAIAFLAGLFVAGRQARRDRLDGQRVTDLAIYVLIAGLIGARLLLAGLEWRYFWEHPGETMALLTSGGVFYGGFLAALPVAFWYSRRHALPGWRTADALAPGLALGQAIGRLGCFAAGCCYGAPAQVPWAVTFRSVDAQRNVGTPLDVPLHPTQVYESLACLAIFVALLWTARRKRFHGQVVICYVVLYASTRFAIEFFRGDLARGFVSLTPALRVSTSQAIAAGLVLGALACLPYLLKRERVAPDPAR